MNPPGYKYCGPFNRMNKGEASNRLDAACRTHDKEYGKMGWIKPYFVYSKADEDLQDVATEVGGRMGHLVNWYFDKKKKYMPRADGKVRGFGKYYSEQEAMQDYKANYGMEDPGPKRQERFQNRWSRAARRAANHFYNRWDYAGQGHMRSALNPRLRRIFRKAVKARRVRKTFGRTTGFKRRKLVSRRVPSYRRKIRSFKRRGKRQPSFLFKVLRVTQKPLKFRFDFHQHIDGTANRWNWYPLGHIASQDGLGGTNLDFSSPDSVDTMQYALAKFTANVNTYMSGKYAAPTAANQMGYYFRHMKNNFTITNPYNIDIECRIFWVKCKMDQTTAQGTWTPLSLMEANQGNVVQFPGGKIFDYAQGASTNKGTSRSDWAPEKIAKSNQYFKWSKARKFTLGPNGTMHTKCVGRKYTHYNYNRYNDANVTRARKGDHFCVIAYRGLDNLMTTNAAFQGTDLTGQVGGSLNIITRISGEVWKQVDNIDVPNDPRYFLQTEGDDVFLGADDFVVPTDITVQAVDEQ